MGPTGPGTSSVIPMLAVVVPLMSLLVVAASVPAVRTLLSDRFSGLREFFWGPDPADQDAEEALGEDGIPLLAVEVPDWFDASIFDEDTADDDGLDEIDDGSVVETPTPYRFGTAADDEDGDGGGPIPSSAGSSSDANDGFSEVSY